MVEIRNYNPGSAPNLAVGAPGMNQAPGQQFRSLAQDIGQVRNQLGQANLGRLKAFLNPIEGQAAYFGQAIARHMLLKDAQVKALGQSTVAESIDKLGATADGAMRYFKQNNLNNPETAPDQLSSIIDDETNKYIDDLKSNKQFKNDPTYATALRNKAADLKKSAMREVNNWSLSQQTTNAEGYVNNGGDSTVDAVAQADGSIADKYGTYQNEVTRYHQLAANKAPVLGEQRMIDKAHDVTLKAGVALYQNIIDDVPSDPMSKLQYLHSADGFLDKAQIPLPGGSKLQLHASINSRVETATAQLVTQMKPAEQLHDIQIRKIGEGLRAVRFSPEAMNSARNFVQTQQDAIEAKIQQTRDNPALPEKAKSAMYSLYAAQQGHLNSLLNTVNSQSDTMAATQRREANELAAQTKQIASQQKAADTIAHGQAKDAALMDIFTTSMEAGQYDPRTDTDKIQKIMESVTKKAIAAHAAGLIDAEKFNSITNHSTAGAVHAANAEAQPTGFFDQWAHGTFGMPIKLKPAKADQKAQARAEATKGISDAVGGLQLINKHHLLNVQAGLSPAEVKRFDTAAARDTKRSQDEHWHDGVLDARLNQRRQALLAERGTHAAKDKPPGNYFVPPPPPLTPSIVSERGTQ